MSTTRTYGPIHPEDLEPHRFEDLVRQLIYDFRDWRYLEPTGRGGADDGYDARGIEKASGDAEPVLDDDDDDEAATPPGDGRVWLIQCKREKAINPKKLSHYLDDLPDASTDGIYGLIFAAACDFSKKSHDLFRAKTRELGFAEAHLWGKAAIEDQLYQPKNDHLLFGYFGFSLKTRQRSLKTEVRARLAMKRKALRHLIPGEPVLIRDASDERYPYLDTDESKPRHSRGRWRVWIYEGARADGLHFRCRRHFAYIGDDGVEWDFAECMNDAHPRDDPWQQKNMDYESRRVAWDQWEALPEHNRGWFDLWGVVPYDHILDIDEKGDEFSEHRHVYTIEFHSKRGPFHHFVENLETSAEPARLAQPRPETRVKKFTDEGRPPKRA